MSTELPLHGLMAQFDDPEALIEAVRRTAQAGYRRYDAFTPFPLLELKELIPSRASVLPLIALAAGIGGGLAQYLLQYWLNVVDYPLNIGGRPLHSWPTFLPATITVAIIWSAAGALIGSLVLSRLPRLHHPVFEIPEFLRASDDRFFLCIFADDPQFTADRVREFLQSLRPLQVHEVPDTLEAPA